MKKSLLLALNLLMITSLLGACTPAKTEETQDKDTSKAIQSDKNTVEEEKADEEVLQGNSVEHETENEPVVNSVGQNDEESYAESQGEEDAVTQTSSINCCFVNVLPGEAASLYKSRNSFFGKTRLSLSVVTVIAS